VCKSEHIEEDISRGDLVCTDCGAVLEENVIVSEAQFHVRFMFVRPLSNPSHYRKLVAVRR
jgi:transcription initiation factor TFIIIB Brf1 subunit/transcription initiation factor TFIIB